MKKIVVGLFFVALIGTSGKVSATFIEWKVTDGGNGHFYGISDLRSGWAEVEAEAGSLGGHLVSINSAAEQLFIVNTFLVSEPTHLASGRPNIFWIGLWDGNIDGVGDPSNLDWSDGSSLTYTNWAPLEPANDFSDEDVVVINWDENETYYDPYEYGRWNDIDVPFVVRANTWNGAFGIMEFETDPNDIPEPATMALLGSGIGAMALKRVRNT